MAEKSFARSWAHLQLLLKLFIWQTRLRAHYLQWIVRLVGFVVWMYVITAATVQKQRDTTNTNTTLGHHKGTTYQPFEADAYWTSGNKHSIYYYPQAAQPLIEEVARKLEIPEVTPLVASQLDPMLNDPPELISFNTTRMPIIIQFNDSFLTFDDLLWRVRIFNICFEFSKRPLRTYRFPNPQDIPTDSTSTVGLILPIVHAVEREIIRMMLASINRTFDFRFHLQRMPHPPYYDEVYDVPSSVIYLMGLTFATLYLLLHTTQMLSSTSFYRLEKYLKLQGVTANIYHWSYRIAYMAMQIPLAILIVTLLYTVTDTEGNTTFCYSDVIVINIFFSLLLSSIYAHAMLLSRFPLGQWSELILCLVYWIFTICVIFPACAEPFEGGYFAVSVHGKLLSSLHPLMNIYWLLIAAHRYEYFSVSGVEWSNLFENSWILRNSEGLDNVCIAELIAAGAMWAIVVWIIASCLIKQRFHQENDENCDQPYEFINTLVLVGDNKCRTQPIGGSYDGQPSPDGQQSPFVENQSENEHKDSVITVHQVYKSYIGKNFSLCNISFQVERSAINVLLGDPQCGTTTILELLLGLRSFSAGTITVFNVPIPQQREDVWKNVAYVQQFTTLFQELTVLEHFELIAKINDFEPNTAVEIRKTLLADIELGGSAFLTPDALTSSRCRVLHVGLSLYVAYAKKLPLIILDKPTEGMTSADQHLIWQQFFELRQTTRCTILLTAVNTYEAEVLADNLIIVSHGTCEFSGNIANLSERYGFGYILKLQMAENYDSDVLVRCIRTHLEKAKILDKQATSLDISLGRPLVKRPVMKMFNQLEQDKKMLCINEIVLHLYSIDDIFLKISNAQTIDTPDGEYTVLTHFEIFTKFINFAQNRSPSYFKTFRGLCKKHYLFYKYTLGLVALLLLVYPSLFLTIGIKLERKHINHNPINVVRDRIAYSAHLFGESEIKYFITSFISSNDVLTSALERVVQGGPLRRVKDLDERNLMQLFATDYNLRTTLLVGFTFEDENNITAWFNGQMPQTVILATELYYNLLYSMIRTATTKEMFKVVNLITCELLEHGKRIERVYRQLSTSENPLPMTMVNRYTDQFRYKGTYISIALCAVAFIFVQLSLYERITQFGHLQYLGGLNGSMRFILGLLIDSVVMTLTIGIVFITWIKASHAYLDYTFLIYLLPSILFFVTSTVALCYAVSQIVTSVVMAGSIVYAFMLFGSFGILVSTFTEDMYNARLEAIPEPTVNWFLSRTIIFNIPTYSFSVAVMKLVVLWEQQVLCRSMTQPDSYYFGSVCRQIENNLIGFDYIADCCRAIANKMSGSVRMFDATVDLAFTDYIGPHAIYTECLIMFFQTFIWLCITTMISSTQLICFIKHLREMFGAGKQDFPNRVLCNAQEDQMVKEEQKLVQDIVSKRSFKEYILTLYRFTKAEYLNSNARNVFEDINLALKSEETLGLVGPQKSGKSVLLSSLAGITYPTCGNAILQNSINLQDNMALFLSAVGYCPQEDALLWFMTIEETLLYFSLLLGSSDASGECRYLSRLLNLRRSDVQAEYCYPQERRKLSVAIAMLKLPLVLLLEEPTRYMDFTESQNVFGSVGFMRNKLQSVCMITSRKVETVEGFCERFAFMLSGRVHSLGTTKTFREKFGAAYTVTIKTRSTQREDAAYRSKCYDSMCQAFSGVEIIENSPARLRYRITAGKIQYSKMFERMSQMRRQLRFQEYYIHQTTLSDEFARFLMLNNVTQEQ